MYLVIIIIGPSILKIANKLYTDDIITVYELLPALQFNGNNNNNNNSYI
jgi:hypothetical protein